MRVVNVLLLLSLLPPTLAAQGMGGMGGMRGMRGPISENTGRRGLPKFATAKELERFNAADALLQDARKLKLTEEQVAQLTTLRATLYERNADLLVRYDSVRRDYHPPRSLENPNQGGGGEPPSQEEMMHLGDQMRAMMAVAEQLMLRRPEQIALCLALVDESQREKANKVLEDQTDDLKDAVPQRPQNGRRR
ncbi:MAG: hypothetical protein IT355_18610 [Gemmatimonadaceae bacterium]|nr:hypothetical protein [Gemmatimonadaceae bacterium]